MRRPRRKKYRAFGLQSERKIAAGMHEILDVGTPLAGLTGLTYDRATAIYWNELEPTIGAGYVYSSVDPIVDRSVAQGLNLVFVLKTGQTAGRIDAACRTAAINGGYSEASCPILPGQETAWKNMLKAFIRRYTYGSGSAYAGVPAWFRFTVQIENEQSTKSHWMPDKDGDGPGAYVPFKALCQLAVDARSEIGSSVPIVAGSIHEVQSLEYCTRNPTDPACTAGDTRLPYFVLQMLQDPAFIPLTDAYDIHYFAYQLLDPLEQQRVIDWLKARKAEVGNTKPLHSYESTGVNLIRFGDDFHPSLIADFQAYFPYTGEFANFAAMQAMYADLSNPVNLKYRKWFAGEGHDDVKIFLTFLANGFDHVQKVRFVDYYPGNSWHSLYWDWNGCFWYEAGPVVVRKPSWYGYQKVLPLLVGAVAIELVVVGKSQGIVTIRISYNDRNPVYIAWKTEANTTAIVEPAALLGYPVVVFRLPTNLTAWDGTGRPILSTVTLSGNQPFVLTHVPVIIERVA